MMRGSVPQAPMDASFAALERLVVERTGHHYYVDKSEVLWERVRRRLKDTGLPDCAAYLERLQDSVRGETEWIALEAEITIGETFFFRYAEQFAALRNTILPEILERNKFERRLRIWSAGCATGAEPYSLAILVRDLLGDDLPNWRVSIVGTDINAAALAAARKAQYGRWALRTTTPDDTARWFLPAEPSGTWLLRPQYRALVRFERHNLLSLLDGTSPLQFTDFDLILCRNVLIYFHPDTVVRIVAALGERLVPGGWLLVGHAEPNPSFARTLASIDLPGTAAYRRRTPGDVDVGLDMAGVTRDQAVLPWAPMLMPEQAAKAALPRRPRLPDLPVRPRAPERRGDPARAGAPSDTASDIDRVRALANTGNIAAARAACRAGIEAQPENPLFHYYDGMTARAAGDLRHSGRAFRNAIYLDKSFAMAHLQLGLLLIDMGSEAAGRRSIVNAAAIARGFDPDASIPEGDGLTAKQFLMLARTYLGRKDGATVA